MGGSSVKALPKLLHRKEHRQGSQPSPVVRGSVKKVRGGQCDWKGMCRGSGGVGREAREAVGRPGVPRSLWAGDLSERRDAGGQGREGVCGGSPWLVCED